MDTTPVGGHEGHEGTLRRQHVCHLLIEEVRMAVSGDVHHEVLRHPTGQPMLDEEKDPRRRPGRAPLDAARPQV